MTTPPPETKVQSETLKQPTSDTSITVEQPQVGDYWEFKLPGKRKRLKEVGAVVKRYGKRADGTEGEFDYVNWQREPKGRYSGLSVHLLLLHGRRVSTKAERDAHLDALIERAKQRRAEQGKSQ